jgi:hypothetical protein
LEFRSTITNKFKSIDYIEGAKRTLFAVLRKVPGVQGTIEKEKAKALKIIRESFETPGQKFDRIPEKGKSYEV